MNEEYDGLYRRQLLKMTRQLVNREEQDKLIA